MSIRGFLKSDSAFAGCLVLLFFCVALASILHHEMWRDEYQHWMIARDSSSLAELAKNAGHERHPGLWYLCLYALSRVTDRAIIMQCFHLVLATGAVYILARYSRFARWQKVLLAFGYFIIYEYTVISRHYVLGMLSVFLLCAVFETRRKSYLPVACVLFLVAQSSVSALLIGLTFAFVMVCEAIGDRSIRRSLSTRKLEIAASLCVVLVGVAISVCQIVTPLEPGEGFAGGGSVDHGRWVTPIHITRIKTTLAAVWQSYIPIPETHYQFWNTNIAAAMDLRAILMLVLLGLGAALYARRRLVLAAYCLGSVALVAYLYMAFYFWNADVMAPMDLRAVLSLVLLALGAALLARRRLAFTAYCLGSLVLLAYFYAIFYIKAGGYLRHHGSLFLLFVACAWIAAYERDRDGPGRGRHSVAVFLESCGKGFLAIILCLQVVAGVIASARDWLDPFSASKAVAAFIEARGMGDVVMVGDSDAPASCIAGRLNRKMHYAAGKRYGTFIVLTRERKKWNRLPRRVRARRILEWASELRQQRQEDVLLILNYPIDTSGYSIVKIGTFLYSTLRTETYYLYLLRYEPPDPGS